MNLIEYAQEYLDEGFNPLPLKSDKAPMLSKDHPFLYQQIDEIKRRFKYAEKIGIACGQVSSGFYCIDFDCHQGQDIETIFQDFYNQPGIQYLVLNDALSLFQTPSGGFHCYFKYENATLPGRVLSRYADGKTMIEIRGNGQYVACFPSEGYQYIDGCEMIKLNYIDDHTINWIMELIQSYTIAPVKEYNDSEKREWSGEWNNSTVDGRYNNESAEEARELLLNNGWQISSKRYDGVEYWVRPGKNPEDGISATWGRRKNMFYVFSSNADPFEQERAYTPFQIYTILKFDGDWKKAKDSLKPPVEIRDEIPQTTTNYSFPINVFPQFLQDYIISLQKTLNFHPDFTSAAIMFAIASVNGNRYKLKVKEGWTAPTIFWFACVGYPGTIKTHPVKTIINPLYKIDKESKVIYDEEMRHWNPEGKPRQPKPKFKQLLVSDYTIEALHSVHDINKRGIGLYKDELVGFLNDMNKYRKGSDEQFWLESFNNASHIINRVTKEPILLDHICINMIGTIQHDVLNKIVSDNKGNGLIDRFLFTASEDKVYNLNQNDIDPSFATKWNELITKMNQSWIYRSDEDCDMVKMTPEAFEHYQLIDSGYVEIQNSEDESQDIKNYLSKMKTYVPRFALLLAIIENIFSHDYLIVDKHHMVNAGMLADYFIGTAKQVFESNAVNQDIRSVAAQLKGLTRDGQLVELYGKGFEVKQLSTYFGISKVHCYRIIKRSQIKE